MNQINRMISMIQLQNINEFYRRIVVLKTEFKMSRVTWIGGQRAHARKGASTLKIKC